MKNPLINRQHITDYLLYGAIAAILYLVFLALHLRESDYESAYLVYIGNAAFGCAIFFYNMKLIKRPYDNQRAMTMLVSAHLASLVGTILSVVFGALLIYFFQPGAFSSNAPNELITNAPSQTQLERPSGWLFMICINALLINFAVGSFVSIMVSYAGKRNQTKDKPAHFGRTTSDEGGVR